MAEQTASAARDQVIDAGAATLPAIIERPADACGVVIFAHGSGSSRLSPRNAKVAQHLREAGLATVLLDLLTEAESKDRRNVFDIRLLASRLQAAARWVRAHPTMRNLPIGLFGASTGAAAALVAAAGDPQDPDSAIRAVVSRGGRPDLAGQALQRVTAPTLLIVGERDQPVLDMNRQAQEKLAGPSKLEIIPRATHLFEEPGALEQVAGLAADWFASQLTGAGPGATPDCRPPARPATSASGAILGFRDRAEAGDTLARALESYRGRDCVVLGLPRGGVEVGAVIARRLGAALDVLLVRKLPAPTQPELALGAVSDGAQPVRVLDERRIRALGLSDGDVERIASEQLDEIGRREKSYRGARPAVDVRGKVVIVVDDGVATGSTAEAALRAVRARAPAELIFAAPVGAPEAIASLGQLCDRAICILQPAGFVAVGAYYAHFDQTTDDRVIQLLRTAAGADAR